MPKLLVGLGNPGETYEHHRHNVGFMALHRIGERYDFAPARARQRFQSLWSKGAIDGVTCLLLWPQTYMNRSGQAVAAVMRYYAIETKDVLVFHDDIDLPCASIKVKWGGSDGGHRGLRDIDSHLRTLGGNAYGRVRLGVGRAQASSDKHLEVRAYVLSAFSKEQKNAMDTLLQAVAEHIPVLVQDSEGDGAGAGTAFIRCVREAV
ncbi:MAG: aminoacyl-tRNA hydrolase [Alphaproteobacteria bacterium GM202ARS2]|nr:aminoacyl-tRNA hydrolase [Alphaproteobacteria bacterium GM202ARS2]